MTLFSQSEVSDQWDPFLKICFLAFLQEAEKKHCLKNPQDKDFDLRSKF